MHEQCAALAPLEQFWAFPGHAAFGVVQELAAAGAWSGWHGWWLGSIVRSSPRCYRSGSLDDISDGEHRDDTDELDHYRHP